MATNLSIAQGLFNANQKVIATWDSMYDSAKPGNYTDYTQRIDSEDEMRIELNWLANHPVMRKHLGARQYKNLRHYSQTITYDPYEASFKLKRDWVDHDQTGVVNQAISTAFGYQVGAVDKAMATAYDASSGAGPTGFDAVSLFNASHPHGPAAAVQSNIGSGTALSHAALAAAEYAGMLLVHENGEPANVVYTKMRVGPKLKRRAQELLSADRVQTATAASLYDAGAAAVAAAARSNVFQGDLSLTVDDRVTTFYWDLIDERKEAKPMVLFMVKEPYPVSRISEEDPHVFEHREYIYGLNGEWGVAGGHWLSCYRGTGTA